MWGWLKPLAKIGASFIPGVGAYAGDAIDAVSGAMGGGAKAAKEGRMDEATLQAQMNSRNNMDSLNAAQFNQRSQGDLMRRALMAKMLGEQQGPSDPRDRFGGPSVSPAMQALMARFGGQAEGDLASGGYKVNPTMSGIPKSGIMEKIGGTAGTIGGILGALNGIGGRGPRAEQTGGGMGGSTGAPNLPYQPLPRAEMTLPSEQWAGGMPMPSGDLRLLEQLKRTGSTPRFEALQGVKF